MELNNRVKEVVEQCINLREYERKQVMSILIMTMLNDIPNTEAKEIYESITNKLDTI